MTQKIKLNKAIIEPVTLLEKQTKQAADRPGWGSVKRPREAGGALKPSALILDWIEPS